MSNEHGYCPSCNANLDGESIWGTFYNRFITEGDWLDEEGKYTKEPRLLSHAEAEKRADEVASNYGATKDKGKWGREIGIYSMELDRTVRWKCPDCDHEWARR